MKKIIVDNFEMIGHQELTLDTNLNILIGPQASGKSTLVKLIFFCRKLRDFLLEYLTNPRNFQGTPPSRYVPDLKNYLRRCFMGYFGTTKHMRKFRIRFYFDTVEERYVALTLDTHKYLSIEFHGGNMWYLIRRMMSEAGFIYRNAYNGDFHQYRASVTYAQNLFKEYLTNLFDDTDELIYIPAGRSVLSILSGAQSGIQEPIPGFFSVEASAMDTLFQSFAGLVQDMKPRFNMPLNEMILDYQKTGENYGLNARAAEQAIPIIHSILRAEYRKDNEGEKLYYTDKDYVKLMFASSGQQEVLWILNLIFLKILENRHIFLVLEEPEAHLFPVAQKGVVDLIALLIHSTGSSVFITTHSPYILTSVNLCVYSARVENNPKLPRKRPDSVVPPHLRIPPKKYSAFMTPEKNARPQGAEFLECIKDEDGLIDATKIDEISRLINGDTDRLINLEVQYDL